MDTTTLLAERAALGSLLVDSSLVSQLSGWLQPDDFARPWHSIVFAVIRDRAASGDPVDAFSLGAALRQRRDSRDVGVAGIGDLLLAVPARPVAAAYVRMVLEASLRRQLGELGALLQAAAGHHRRVDGDYVIEARSWLDTAGTILAGLGARWQAAHSADSAAAADGGGRPRHLAVADSTWMPAAFMDNAELAQMKVAAKRLVTGRPRRTAAVVARREASFIGALINQPDRIPYWARQVRPGSLADPGWRAVYEALIRLHEAGLPIDPVTTAWDVHRHARIGGARPCAEEIQHAADAGFSSDADRAGRRVAADRLTRLADCAAVALRASAGNHGVAVPDLLDTADLLTHGIRAAIAATEPPTANLRPRGAHRADRDRGSAR